MTRAEIIALSAGVAAAMAGKDIAAAVDAAMPAELVLEADPAAVVGSALEVRPVRDAAGAIVGKITVAKTFHADGSAVEVVL